MFSEGQGRVTHGCMLSASCTYDSGCPVPQLQLLQCCNASSDFRPLELNCFSKSWQWDGIAEDAGTAAHELHLHCAPSSFFTPTCSSVCTLDNLPITHAVCSVNTHIKEWACSLVPAFPRNPTSIISPSVVRLLHWPTWDTPCPYCFTCQVFHFLLVYQIRKLNMLKKTPFLCLIFQPDISQTHGPTEPRKWEWASHLGKCGIYLDGH